MKKSKCWQWANCNKICTKIVRSSREKKESSQIIGALPKATRNETGRWTKNNVPAYWKTIKARLGKSSLYTPRVQRFSSPSPANVARPFRRGNRDIGKRPTTKFSKLKRPVPRIASLPAKINASDAEHLRNTHTHTHTHDFCEQWQDEFQVTKSEIYTTKERERQRISQYAPVLVLDHIHHVNHDHSDNVHAPLLKTFCLSRSGILQHLGNEACVISLCAISPTKRLCYC